MDGKDAVNVKGIRESLKNFDFEGLFIEELGWGRAGQRDNIVSIKQEKISYSYIAQLKHIPILYFDGVRWNQFKQKSEREKLHKEIKKQHEKNLLIFSDKETFFSLSYLNKDNSIKIHDYHHGQNGDAIIGKLSGIHIGIDAKEPSISAISDKLDKAFNTDKVTKKFYQEFRSSHSDFQKHISGIKGDKEKAWYSSVILNRLMFIWFLQKKGFLDDDIDYLQKKFEQYSGEQRSYYRSFLKYLFFEGFAKRPHERSTKVQKILGKIKYLNGGLFIPHSIEEKYKKIDINDKAFENIFNMFSKYDWHNESEGGDNEISPDVLGHIFEKYINDSQRKSCGAYYTPDEITTYLARKNIRKYLVEKINERGYYFESIDQCLHDLNASLCKILLTDENSILNTLSILDPAVGSGAFLIAAMKELINIYGPLLGKMETLNNRELRSWLDNFRESNKSIAYGIKKQIILKNLYGVDIMKEAVEVCKLRLFLSLASSALEKSDLEPLPNIDFNIMAGNSLIGFLKKNKSEDQLSLFGTSYTQLLSKYKRAVEEYKNKNLSFDKLIERKQRINNFLEKSNKELNEIIAEECGEKKLKYEELNASKRVEKRRAVIKNDIDETEAFHWDFAFNDIIESGGFDIILTNPPWDKVKIEDKEFLQQYDRSIRKNKTLKIDKKIKELLKDKSKRKDYITQNSFCKFLRKYFREFYKYQSGKIINPDGTEKQSGSDMDTYRIFLERCINLVKKKSGRIGLVIPSGFGKDDGAVGLRRYIFDHIKIEGLINFQNQGKNGKFFDGVASGFTFGLLNLQKNSVEDKFPCLFGTRDLKLLETFPKNALTLIRSIRKIKERSPRDVSITEFKSPMDEAILDKTIKFPILGEQRENSWNIHIYREFDETDDRPLFKSCKKDKHYFPLYKGSAIWQYDYSFKPEEKNRFISINTKKVKNFRNKYYKNYRLMFRSITSNTNERSLISSIIPQNSFITNSLQCIHVEKERLKGNKYTLLLQSFFNSFVVDYFLRQKISSNVNKKFLLHLRIPRLTEKDHYFNQLVKKSAQLTCIGKEFNKLADEIDIPRGGVKDKNKRWKIQAEIDAIVAHIYGLTQKEYKHILGTFTTGKDEKRRETLKELSMEEFLKYENSLTDESD